MINEPRPQKILLIDDEPSVLFALKLLLQALGFAVADYHFAEDAIEFMRSDSSCNICICDLRMPSMSGIEVLQEMKRIRPEFPFVLMSAHASEEEFQQATALGAAGFLSKPFTPEELKELVAAATGLPLKP